MLSDLVKKASSMSGAVSISRVLGLVREQVFAFLFGASTFSDAYLLAFRIPNLFRDLLAEGALGSAFLSVFSKIKSKSDAQALKRQTEVFLSLVFFVLASLLYYFAPDIVSFLAEDFKDQPGKHQLSVELTRFLLPFLYFASLAAVATSLLNSLGYYFWPSLGPALFNLSCIIGGAFAYYFSQAGIGEKEIWIFSGATLLGGFLQWAFMWPLLLKKNYSPFLLLKDLLAFPFKIVSYLNNKELKRVLVMMGPAIIGMASVQINVLINTFFAASQTPGSITWLNYAFRLEHLPIGLIGVALSMASLPKLARNYRDNKINEFHSIVMQALKIIFSLGTIASLVYFFFGDVIISLLFERGRFAAYDTQMTFAALRYYSIGLCFFMAQKIFVSAFYAMEKVWLPYMISFAAIAVNFILARELSESLGHKGLALANSLSIIMQVIALLTAYYFLLIRKRKKV